MNSFIPHLFYFPTPTSGGPTADDVKNADALGDAEKRRNEILTERLDLERQLYKFESDITKQINKRIQLDATVRENINATKDIEKSILKNIQTSAVIQNRINHLGSDAAKQAAVKISSLKKQIQLEMDLGKQETLYNELRKESTVEGAYQLSILNDQVDALQEENVEFKGILEESKKLDKGIFNITGNIVAALPGLGKFSQTFKDAAIESRKAGGGMAGIVAGTKKIVDLAPEAVFIMLAKSTFQADQQATALGKSLGISKNQAYELRENFVQYSRAVNDSFITTDRLAKAQADLSEQLGIAVQYSGEELSIFAKLTEIVGLSAQEAGKLASFSAAAGMSSIDYVKQIRASSFAAQQANKVHFSDKQILQDVSKLSAGILVKFQNNPKALAAAVVQAKALGLTLEQVDKAGESLLNFESSIENELKAELITGKQLNFERARAAALTGDQAALMQEVASQTGTLAEFQDMNVIAQKSLAEAFGMSRDELADMLMKQEAITKYGSKAAELNKEQLEYMKEHSLSADQMLDKITNQRSVQDKFNDAMLKLQDIIGNLAAGPLGKFVSYLAEGLDYVAGIAIAFGSIYTLQKGIALYQRAIALMKGKELAVQIGIAAAWAIANPFTALAGLAIAGGIASLIVSQMSAAPKFAAGGIVTSEINNATIGEAGPEAIIPLNSSKAAGMLGGMDILPLVSAINEVRNAVNALANKPQQAIALNVSGQKLGEVVGRQAETGTNQYQNAYQLA